MKKLLLLLSFALSFGSTLMAENCFLAKEKDAVLVREGDPITQYAPCSTFKIALSLIGFDSGILLDENRPKWSCKNEDDCFCNVQKGDHTPRTWMRDSCVWYSQILTKKLGMEKFKEYVEKFNYGNLDLSGEKGKNNGLTYSWLSSLQISPEEQTAFLQKVVEKKLLVSDYSYKKTKKIMFIQELSGGWKLYGKTGSGMQHGWFVGYIEKNQRQIVFASHVVDNEKQSVPASFRARNEALIKLWYLINDLEK